MPKTITKSVRLQKEEADWLSQIAKSERLSEAALMNRLIAEGIGTYRVQQAISLYADEEIDLSNAARIAGLSVRRMMAALRKQNIPIHESEEMFEAGLRHLAEAFDDQRLKGIVPSKRKTAKSGR